MDNIVKQNVNNFFTMVSVIELMNGSNPFGKSFTRYEIYRRRDVSNLNSILGYLVVMKQRIIIPNQNVQSPGPTSSTSYNNYPAILLNKIDIQVNNAGAQVTMQSIFPRTLNSSVSTSSSSNTGSSNSNSVENSNGSSNTNVNTFGVSIMGGFFGELPMGSISLDYSHSWENSKFSSAMTGRSSALESSNSAGESMSIKDWSSYGYLDNDSVSPRWIFGQSFPWDVIQYNQSSNNSVINLPSFVVDRLLNGLLVLPPSQLSLFGLDFTVQAIWIIDFPDGVTSDETIQINHTTKSYLASHQLAGSTISATLQSDTQAAEAQYSSGIIDLSMFALSPLNGAAAGSGAAIGFAANPFTYPPVSPSSTFKIISPANNLQIKGTGFDPEMTSDFSKPTSLIINFKVADVSVNYSLFLMHWIEQGSGACKLNWNVNGRFAGSIFVDSVEGAGGQNNISTIELRNTDFTSINFHDYLQLGTNTVEIIIEPADPKVSSSYSLFAIAVGLP